MAESKQVKYFTSKEVKYFTIFSTQDLGIFFQDQIGVTLRHSIKRVGALCGSIVSFPHLTPARSLRGSTTRLDNLLATPHCVISETCSRLFLAHKSSYMLSTTPLPPGRDPPVPELSGGATDAADMAGARCTLTAVEPVPRVPPPAALRESRRVSARGQSSLGTKQECCAEQLEQQP